MERSVATNFLLSESSYRIITMFTRPPEPSRVESELQVRMWYFHVRSSNAGNIGHFGKAIGDGGVFPSFGSPLKGWRDEEYMSKVLLASTQS